MAPSRKIFALKRIRLTGRDQEAAAGFIDEITLLQRLRGHSNIIQLIDAEVVPLTIPMVQATPVPRPDGLMPKDRMLCPSSLISSCEQSAFTSEAGRQHGP
jgi:serine/threonine protein kinase